MLGKLADKYFTRAFEEDLLRQEMKLFELSELSELWSL